MSVVLFFCVGPDRAYSDSQPLHAMGGSIIEA
jgi:hypothetical protein